MFPGRQFKDARGKVSDASVWARKSESKGIRIPLMSADPTLHRLSTSSEIASIKRRAAPKLFRTRRLANGELVRSRAGPAVEAKFREIRENIAETRRQRGSVMCLTASPLTASEVGSYQTPDSPVVTTPTFVTSPLTGNSMSMNNEGKPRLANITEGVEAHDVSAPFVMEDEQRKERVMSVDTTFQPSPQGMDENRPPLTPLEIRAFQSCPASIHTTPVPASTSLKQAQVLQQWSAFFNQPPLHPSHPGGAQQIKSTRLRIDTAHGQKIEDGVNGLNQYTFDQSLRLSFQVSPSGSGWTPTPVTGTPNVLPAGIDLAGIASSWSSYTPGMMHRDPLQSSWGDGHASPPPPGTIDPRWVSPLSSLWSTPAPSRSGSPIQSDAMQLQFPHNQHVRHDRHDHTQQIHIQHVQHQHAPQQEVHNALAHAHISGALGLSNEQGEFVRFGTQSYPPRQVERRQMESPHHVPLYTDAFPGGEMSQGSGGTGGIGGIGG